jgi:hypothetical protein
MNAIFDSHTEIGHCEYDLSNEHSFIYTDAGRWLILVQTTASFSSKRMIKVEQRCFLRSADHATEQPLLKPEVALEPAIGGEEEAVKAVQEMHDQFAERVRKQLSENSVLSN